MKSCCTSWALSLRTARRASTSEVARLRHPPQPWSTEGVRRAGLREANGFGYYNPDRASAAAQATRAPRLGRSSSHQKAILANLAASCSSMGGSTTEGRKAQARPYAEKLITYQKRRVARPAQVLKLRDKDVAATLFANQFFADRDGCFTQHPSKMRARKGDNAPMAVIEWLEDGDLGGQSSTPGSYRAGRPEGVHA